jgi:hypothetical protein
MQYQKPVVQITMLDNEDVITTSQSDNVGAGRSDWSGWSFETNSFGGLME